MKIVTYRENQAEKLGLVVKHKIYPCLSLDSTLPSSLLELLKQGDQGLEPLKIYQERIELGEFQEIGILLEEAELLAPLPNPTSFRDAYAFRQHVATSRANRGLEMIPEFDQFPVFYFSNHQAIQGPGKVYGMPRHFEHLDFELEVAIVINKTGRNIQASEADEYIGGFMILNDVSARTLQMEEMKLNLGPAKGKDFVSAFGPYFVTKDELIGFLRDPKEGHIGNTYNLNMTCKVNGTLLSAGNLSDMDWTFAEIIERVSYGVTLYPGDIIGSGTVGTGCLLELNGTGKRSNADYQEQWLNPGDIVEMEVTGLGVLINEMVLTEE